MEKSNREADHILCRFPYMFENVGLYGSAGIAAGLMFVFSVLPTFLLHWKGKAWRQSREEF